MKAPEPLTVLVPTRNERDNISPFLDRLPGCVTDVIFCDDSDDGTDSIIATFCGAGHPHVRLLHRTPAARSGGLSGAIVAALALVDRGDVCVIDGDLQHPPEDIALLATRRRSEHGDRPDLVVAIRAGDIATATMSPIRQRLSWLAGRTAFAVFRTVPTADPMSGFFLFGRESIDTRLLRPHGFKILLELLVTHPHLQVADVAYTFQPRASGTSKGTVREGLRFGRHVIRLVVRRISRRRTSRAAGM